MKKWTRCSRRALDALKENPWDGGILTELARACEAQEFDEAKSNTCGRLSTPMTKIRSNRLLAVLTIAWGISRGAQAFSRVVKALPKDEEGIKAPQQLGGEENHR